MVEDFVVLDAAVPVLLRLVVPVPVVAVAADFVVEADSVLAVEVAAPLRVNTALVRFCEPTTGQAIAAKVEGKVKDGRDVTNVTPPIMELV